MFLAPRRGLHKPVRPRSYRPQLEPLDDRLLLATFLVLNTNDAGPGSLPQAILDANTHPGMDTIAFRIGSGGVQTIGVGSTTAQPLPDITDPVLLDGWSQGGPGYKGPPLIELDGTSAGASADGLAITAGGGSTVQGLAINRFGGAGIRLATPANLVAGNYVGTDVTGTLPLGNASGVLIDNTANNTIGGDGVGTGNVIAANRGVGVQVSGPWAVGNFVGGNLIGTNAAGTVALGNGAGGVAVLAGANGNVIGGAAPGARNVISGNQCNGVQVTGDGTTGTLVQGNFIGTDFTGAFALGNSGNGVAIQGAANNLIGGPAATARNVIAGSGQAGVLIQGGGAKGNRVEANFIGTDGTGSARLDNVLFGVYLLDASGNTVGGTTAATRNLLSGNGVAGVCIAMGFLSWCADTVRALAEGVQGASEWTRPPVPQSGFPY
jgi:titin